ncbi:TPA: hypothetical protein KBO98_004539, partial [Escherichia coli]|nr:hypothetical protein [Escherichia coli]
MNKIYKVIWNHINECWIVVSELCKSRTNIKCMALTSGLLSVAANASISTSSCVGDICYVDGTVNITSPWEDGNVQLSIGGNNEGVLTVENSAIVRTYKLNIGENYNGEL